MNLLLSVAVAVLGAWVWLLSRHDLPAEQLQALQLVYSQIESEAVKPQDGEDLMWSAIEGMVGSIDDHSEFVRPSAVAEFEEGTTGTYVGIGIVMETADQTLRVRFPFADGPSEKAGLRVGDRIVKVDGEPIVGETQNELRVNARKLLLGPAGTKLTVTVEREGEGEVDYEIWRGDVHKPSVKWTRLLDDEQRIGYVYLATFQSNSTSELVGAIDQLQLEADQAGGPLEGLILDLRFNRGGLLDEAQEIANLFQREGTIVSTRRRNSEETDVRSADPERCLYPDLDVVVLVNGGSASASEVVAGALQDHERAALIGERTWGKGLVQSIFRWKDLDFRLKLTTAQYYTPSGRSIERQHRTESGELAGGIAPNQEVAISDQMSQTLYTILNLTNEPPADHRDAVRELSKALGIDAPEAPGPEDDPQLAAALSELQQRSNLK